MARHIGYYDYEDDLRLTCPQCGWSGRAGDAAREYYRELFDVSCPRCDRMLVIVPYATADETRAAAASGDPRAEEELAVLERAESFHAHFDRMKLRDPAQLHELPTRRSSHEALLKDRYGARFRTLTPTHDSELWLYGDRSGRVSPE